tara:strand:- start:104 stop:784 length:681 start_codon:yes stop_codon:yes gene_type:complete
MYIEEEKITRFEKFKVYRNFITPTYQKEIAAAINQASWVYQTNMDLSYTDPNETDLMRKQGMTHAELKYEMEHGYQQFMYNIFNALTNTGVPEVTPLHYALIGLTSKITDEILPGFHNYRTRAVLHTDMKNAPKHYIPHTDVQAASNSKEVWSFIYYPIDCTGKTHLFYETCHEVLLGKRRSHEWKSLHSVTPKAGTLIQFPSKQYHCGSPPSQGYRCAINFNYTT